MKKQIVTLLALSLSGFAMADGLKNEVKISSQIGHTEVKSIGYGDLNYGLGITDKLKLNDGHNVFVGLYGKRTLTDESWLGKDTRMKGYDVKAGYGYDFPVNYSLTVTPYAAVGYESNILKSSDYGKEELNRGYGELGIDSKYMIDSHWLIGMGAKYQRDLNSKEKVNDVYLDRDSRGYRYEGSVSVSRDLGKYGDITVSPYYGKYVNKRADTQRDVQDTGVRVNYDF